MATQLLLLGRARAEGLLDRVVGTMRRKGITPLQVSFALRVGMQVLLIQVDTISAPALERFLAHIRRFPDILSITQSVVSDGDADRAPSVVIVSPAGQTSFAQSAPVDGIRHIATVGGDMVFTVPCAVEQSFVQVARNFGQVWICSLAGVLDASSALHGAAFAQQPAPNEEDVG